MIEAFALGLGSAVVFGAVVLLAIWIEGRPAEFDPQGLERVGE